MTQINLTQLREEAQAYIDRQDLWDNGPNAQGFFMAHDVLALIDTAEAAIHLNEHLAMIGGGRKTESAYYRLRETLNNYTTT